MNINKTCKLTIAAALITLVTQIIFQNNIKYVYLGKEISVLRDLRLTQEQYSDIVDSADISEKIDLIKNVKCFYFYNIPEQIGYLFYLIYIICIILLLVNTTKNLSKND